MTTSILVRRPADPELCRISAVAGDRPVYEVDQLTASGCKSRRIDPDEIGAILGASPLEDFSPFGSLRWIHSSAAGVDAWLAEGGIPEGVTLTSATGNGAVPLAEHAIMLMLMLNRNACRWFAAQQRKEWDRFVHGELAGASLGIIGYGNSGRNLARKALPFHMRVRALRRTGQDEVDDGVDLLHGDDGLRELLANSDFVVVTAPLTPETRHLIGAEQLDWMRPNACIVVVSRGGIVETDALVRALHEGRLAGAGLDAHAIEPLPSDSSLWQMENVIVTPHNGATTAATVERGRQILLENVERWVNGRSLRNVVDPDRGYCRRRPRPRPRLPSDHRIGQMRPRPHTSRGGLLDTAALTTGFPDPRGSRGLCAEPDVWIGTAVPEGAARACSGGRLRAPASAVRGYVRA